MGAASGATKRSCLGARGVRDTHAGGLRFERMLSMSRKPAGEETQTSNEKATETAEAKSPLGLAIWVFLVPLLAVIALVLLFGS